MLGNLANGGNDGVSLSAMLSDLATIQKYRRCLKFNPAMILASVSGYPPQYKQGIDTLIHR